MAGLLQSAKLWSLLLDLRSPDWPKRVTAAKLLGELKDPRAVEPLAELLAGHTPTLMGGLLEGETSKDSSLEHIYGANDCNRQPVREAAARALGQIGGAHGVPALCAAALMDPEPSVQAEAARALGSIGSPSAAESLAPLLRSSFAEVREAALSALARIGPPAIQWLLPMLKQSTFEARQAAAKALGLIDDPKTIPPLLAALADPDYQVRCEVIEALASVCKSAEQPLLDVLKDGKVEVRLAVAKTLGKIRDPGAIMALQEATNDESAEVRAAAWHALKLLGWQAGLAREQTLRAFAAGDLSNAAAAGVASVEPLIEAYRGGDRAVRDQVGEALQLIGSVAIPPLFDVLLDDDRDVRHFAARKLEGFGWQPEDAAQRVRLAIAMGRYATLPAEGPVVFEPLVAALKASSDWDRATAAKTLGELGDARAVEPVAAMLGDDAYNVREAAANALGVLGGEPAIAALRSALNDGHYNVRAAARGALKKLGIVVEAT
jgi:HEAT repeat protein